MLHRRALLTASLVLTPFGAWATPPDWNQRLVQAAVDQIGRTIRYDPAYVRLGYPGGDVPIDRGVCSDVVIRAYRQGVGIDLQQQIHEDMAAHFAAYPKTWGLSRPDRNIDHRRVPNLETFLRRRGAALPDGAPWRAGDLVTQRLPGNLPHILILDTGLAAPDRPMAIHNIGAGTRREDVLRAWPIAGHFRYPGG